jgi:hypothetical protein
MNCLSTWSYSENIYILWSKCVRESFFYRTQLLNEFLEELGGSWYVQNASTFPNPFAIVSPLICVFWIQLTRTNAVFGRIALVSHFCVEIWLSGKISENPAMFLFYQKTHGARIRDGEGPRGAHTTWWRGPGQAALGGGVAAPAIVSIPPSAYIYSMT